MKSKIVVLSVIACMAMAGPAFADLTLTGSSEINFADGTSQSTAFEGVSGGGFGNSAGGSYATVAGGWNNTAYGHRSTVGGGYGNTAYGYCSTVPGGRNNTALG